MCNLYSCTKPREALIRLFQIGHNRAEATEPQAAIFPANDAPIVRLGGDGERELVTAGWGFVLTQKDRAPKRVTNFRDDKLDFGFWSKSFRERRCLVPVTSFSEPKGKKPATWHWFALDKSRPLFAFAGIWRHYKGPLKKDADPVEVNVYSFMTTTPNELVATVHPQRMPVMLTTEEEWARWLTGTTEEARSLVRSYPADRMEIVRSGIDRKDLLTAR